MKIALAPELGNLDDGVDFLARIGFYLAHLDVDEIVVPVAHPQLGVELQTELATIGDNAKLLDRVDPVVVERVARIAGALSFVTIPQSTGNRAHPMADAIATADLVFSWDEEATRREPWARLLEGRRDAGLQPHWNVDKYRKRLEGSIYIEAAYRARANLDELTTLNRAKFNELYLRLGRFERAYVFGTGPLVDRFADFDFSDGLAIICNTIVLDRELLDHVKPRILAFADPVFHFGVARYAAEFRAAAAEAARRYDMTIVVPLKYYEMFVSLLPDLEDRTIGVPMDAGAKNLDLLTDYRVRSYANVLTLLMLPLAVTFGKRVSIIGCDGRAPQGEDYFWRHNPRTQLVHLMDNVAEMHPAFFDLDYEAYFDDHSTVLSELITKGEMVGVEFDSITPSYIPALARRGPQDEQWRTQLHSAVDRDADFVWLSINPDCEDEFGHYSPYDARVREAAAAVGGDVVTLASRAYRGGDGNEHKAVALFTHNSFAVTRNPSDLFVATFRAELRALMAEAVAMGLGRDIPASFIMYVGSARHLMVMLELADEFSQSGLHFLVNLFWAHPELHGSEELLERGLNPTSIVLNATRTLRAKLGVRTFVDTEELRSGLMRGTGENLMLWPMFSTTKLPTPNPEHSDLGQERRGPVTVYNPGTVQYAKGYDIFADVVTRMRDDVRSHSIRFVARELVRPGTDRQLLERSESLREAGALMIEGTLGDDEYFRHFDAADIIVIPYRRNPFFSRTSAVLSDAMLLGKPIVAAAGTWAGRQVEEFGVGVTFEEDDIESFRTALLRVIGDYAAFRRRAVSASVAWSDRHNPERFVAALREAGGTDDAPTGQSPTAAILTSIEQLLAASATMTANIALSSNQQPRSDDASTGPRRRRKGYRMLRVAAKLVDVILRPFPKLHARLQRRYWASYGTG